MPTLNLNGLIPAIVTPFTRDGQVDVPALRRYVEWLVPQGPVALAVNADTGEGPNLTPDERRLTIETVAEAAAGRCGVVAGIAGSSTALGIANARAAQAAGADALLMFPISAYLGQPLNPEVPYQYHAAVAEAVDLPLILFQLQPALGGVLFEPEIIHRLIEIPTVTAIKEASFDALRFLQVKAALQSAPRPIALLNGNDNFIYEAFVLGADGALLGFATLGLREQVEMLAAVRQQDFAAGQALGARLQPFADLIFAPPVTDYRARTKYALSLLGVIENIAVRPPLLPLAQAELAGIRRSMLQAGLLEEKVHA